MNGKLTPALLAVLVVATVATPVAADADADAEPSLVLELAEDGSAEVTLTLTYDLRTDAERGAFRELEDDADTRRQFRERFRDRMATVAATAEDASGREMSVDGAAIDVYTTPDDGTGVVELTVTWNGLAAVEDDRLAVTEPFASGFETDRPVTLAAPDGYELASATPEPTAADDGRATWEPGTDFQEFEATFDPGSANSDGTTAEGSDETTATGSDGKADGSSASSGIPGFGIGVAVASLVGAALLGLRR